MKLYGTPPTRAIRAIWLLNELEIPCEIVVVDLPPGEHQRPVFKTINPAGKVPVLVDGDLVIPESSAIQLYLAEKYGRFIPSDLATRAQMYRWIFFLVTEIEQPLWRIALNTRIYREAERVAADLPNASRDGKAAVGVLEQHMKGRRFVVGHELSVADFNAAYTLDWAEEAGLMDEAPNLKAWLAQMYARPKAAPTIAEGFASVGKARPEVW